MNQPKVTPTNDIAPIHCLQCDDRTYIIRRKMVWTFQWATPIAESARVMNLPPIQVSRIELCPTT
jgi:hypothetical protein